MGPASHYLEVDPASTREFHLWARELDPRSRGGYISSGIFHGRTGITRAHLLLYVSSGGTSD